jgi:transposase-like protein
VDSLPRYRRGGYGSAQLHRGRQLRPKTDRDGYLGVTLYKDGFRANRHVHQLVLEAFRGPCPPGMVCRHLDGSRSNNNFGNLRWGTPAENSADRAAHGTTARGERSGPAALRDADVPVIHREYAAGATQAEIARRHGVGVEVIYRALRGATYRDAQPETPAALRPRERARGSAHGNARLTEEAVREIRQMYATGRHTQCELARRFGVSSGTVSNVVNRRFWAHVGPPRA